MTRRPAPTPIAIGAAAVVCPFGLEWRGLFQAMSAGPSRFGPLPLPPPFHQIEAAAIDDGLLAQSPVHRRELKKMSRSAHLAAIVTHRVLGDLDPQVSPASMGFFLGVGASGATIGELTAMLEASIDAHQFSLKSFGKQGLLACNPLFAFQLMNNFTLCHSAIRHEITGPNAALFSRGGGTVSALIEALYALRNGDCQSALAGGADSACHPVTLCELSREGFIEGGLRPGEGGALLSLHAQPSGGLASIVDASLYPSPTHRWGEIMEQIKRDHLRRVDALVLAPWGAPSRVSLRSVCADYFPNTPLFDLSLHLGEALAATPALAWAVGLDYLQTHRSASTTLVLSLGPDGDLGAVSLRKEREA